MRVLFLHADQFSYQVTGDTSITAGLPPILEEQRQGQASDVLVCMVAVESGDAQKADSIMAPFLKDIEDLCQQLDAQKVFLHPYAHLSASLEAPKAASQLFKQLFERLNQTALQVQHSPFGVYKRFDIQVKGHPLSELGRTYQGDANQKGSLESQALKHEEALKSKWVVLMPDGQSVSAHDFDFKKYPALQKLWEYEQSGSRKVEQAPPHIQLMQEHELVDYEPGSDQGNLRWYPKGYLVKKLLEDQIDAMMHEMGAMQIETPIMYDYEHPALAKYLNKFPARQYRLKSDKKDFFLRFAACFGQYLMKHDMQMSYKHLPLRLYELTHSSFRREQSGELAGLRRLRAFTMPDMHTLCADMPQAIEEVLRQVQSCLEWRDVLGYEPEDYAVALRLVEDFHQANPDYARQLAEKAGQPILLEIWEQRFFYFVTKFELNFIDTQGKASALSTVQIDVENPEQFGIQYIAGNGEKHHPYMLHTSVAGAIERNLFALLEKQARRIKSSQKAEWPYWLAPTQIRLIPVRENHIEHCQKLLQQLPGRVDIDDRDETLSKRIRAAEKEWVPLVIVVGDQELAQQKYPVRFRGQRGETMMLLPELANHHAQQMQNHAFRPINLPKLLSLRASFRG